MPGVTETLSAGVRGGAGGVSCDSREAAYSVNNYLILCTPVKICEFG